MTRTATRVAAAVGATVVMAGLATPAMACTTTDEGGRSSAVSSDTRQADPAKASWTGKHLSSVTLADAQAKLDRRIAARLAWLDKVEAKVSGSDRLSADQQSGILSRLQSVEDALTQLRGDIAAATTRAELRSVLASDNAARLMQHRGWGFGTHHDKVTRANHDKRGNGFDRNRSQHHGDRTGRFQHDGNHR
jgi:hypothetical protein